MIAIFPIVLVFLFSLAGRVSAFTLNVTLGGQVLFAKDWLPTSYPAPIDKCRDQCNSVQSTLAGAQDNATIICSNSTADALVQCEQCMFTNLINANKPMPEARAGSNPLMTGYGGACALFNQTLAKNQTSLALPPTWDGPFGLFVPTGGLVVTVGAGAILGVSSILILSNM